MVAVIRHRQRLGKPLGLIVHPRGPLDSHFPSSPPIEDAQGIAIYFGSRGQKETRTLRLCQAKSLVRSESTDLESLNRVVQVVDWTRQ